MGSNEVILNDTILSIGGVSYDLSEFIATIVEETLIRLKQTNPYLFDNEERDEVYRFNY